MRMRRYAVCYTNPDPLSCRTGYTILKTYNTLSAARAGYARTKGRGLFVAERQGDHYVKYNTPTNEG